MQQLPLTESMHLAMDFIEEQENAFAQRKQRFLQSCLVELKGSLAEPWQFDKANRLFWKNTNEGNATPQP